MQLVDKEEGQLYCLEIEEAWAELQRLLQSTESALLQGLAQQPDVTLDDRIVCIECSHARIESALAQLPTCYANPEDAAARRKELQVRRTATFLSRFKATNEISMNRHCTAIPSGNSRKLRPWTHPIRNLSARRNSERWLSAPKRWR